nr:EF-hand domain-containing protein [uncultured Sphingomonas sp.]
MIKKLLIGAGAAALAATAFAAPAMMSDGEMTRAEMTAKVRDHFTKMDTNKDGAVSKDEIGAMGGPGHRMDKGPGDANVAFDRIDVNKDGSISRDEFAQGRQIRIEKRVMMRDGAKMGHDEHGSMGGRRGGGHMRMMAMADSNNDGRITLPEAEAMAMKHFDQMDSNKDGKVTREERKAAREQMMKMHQGGQPS